MLSNLNKGLALALAVAVLGTPEDKARYREAVNTAHCAPRTAYLSERRPPP